MFRAPLSNTPTFTTRTAPLSPITGSGVTSAGMVRRGNGRAPVAFADLTAPEQRAVTAHIVARARRERSLFWRAAARSILAAPSEFISWIARPFDAYRHPTAGVTTASQPMRTSLAGAPAVSGAVAAAACD